MGLFGWLFGKKSRDDETDDISTSKILDDFETAERAGNIDEVIRDYNRKLGLDDLSAEDFDLDDETLELLDELELKYAEKTRNQQIMNLTDKQRETMVAKKHDVSHQLKICERAMSKGSILPFPFERAVILLTKEKRYAEALELCEYTAWWCADAKQGYDGWSAMHFNSPVLKKIVERIPKLKAKLA